ncbi:MAG: hypothetical protein O2968_04055 [Acidobacteria bacterium]|nr:hypothetical protein [Acidobacteriota bacterium]
MTRTPIHGVLGAAVALLLCAAPLAAADVFKVEPAGDYPARQNQGGVTVAVKPFQTDNEVATAFGKAKPLKYGFLPVLVVIDNDSDHSLSLEQLKVRFIASGRDGLEPTSGEDLTFYQPSTRPKERPRYIPSVPGLGRPKLKKGPLAKPEITGREFKAPVITPHSSASGFFYYDTGTHSDPVPGASIYISGIRNLNTGKELFYFEIPLTPYAK